MNTPNWSVVKEPWLDCIAAFDVIASVVAPRVMVYSLGANASSIDISLLIPAISSSEQAVKAAPMKSADAI